MADQLPLNCFVEIFEGLDRYSYDPKFKKNVDMIEEWTRTQAKSTTDLEEYGKILVIVGLKLSGKHEEALSFMHSLMGIGPL